jgi:hypothetical protein
MHGRRLPPVLVTAGLACAGLFVVLVGAPPGAGGPLSRVAATAPPSADAGVGAHVIVRPTAPVSPTVGPTQQSASPQPPPTTGAPVTPTVAPSSPTATTLPAPVVSTSGAAGGEGGGAEGAGGTGAEGETPVTGAAVWRPALLGLLAIALGTVIAWWAVRRRRDAGG